MITDIQLEKIVFALELADKPDKRDELLKSHFDGVSKDVLLSTWKNRIASDSSSQLLADQVWATYQERLNAGEIDLKPCVGCGNNKKIQAPTIRPTIKII
ncbi:MAG: hypothetical protein M0R50_10570 [Candidatus Cloacimonetes bacterium]|jgi:hypothetical protein|nr:hypothetical protein [Candidatus Cloacimonadota bacterium]